MSYSLDPVTDQCYPGTTVLVNRYDIRDEAVLNEVESSLTAARYAQWLIRPQMTTFDFGHYRAIHHFLFSELYDWAGQIRTVDIRKKDTSFCPVGQIEERAGLIFERLKREDFFRNLPKEDFTNQIADFYCVTNALHPFREGNGRTQRAFLTQLIYHAGYSIRFSEIDTDLLMIATIQAAHGVRDTLYGVFQEAITGVADGQSVNRV